MNDATHGADDIRSDITALAQRYAIIEQDEECGVAWQVRILMVFSLVFPSLWCMFCTVIYNASVESSEPEVH